MPEATSILLLLPVLLMSIALALVVAWRLRRGRREREAPRDDLRRAGDETPSTPEDAASRAVGAHAWMRPGGF